MSPPDLVDKWGNDPVAGIASELPNWQISTSFLDGTLSLSTVMMPWVAILACTILVIAANAGILAGSRITYNMARHRQLFGAFSRVNPRRQTPSFAIVVISGVAMVIIAAGIRAQDLLLKLGDLYVFSSMMAFSMAHLSIWRLRIKEPHTPRPFWAWPTIHIGGKPISVTATLGFLACAAIWLWMAVSSEHAFGRNIGLTWLGVGLAFYIWFRRRQGLDLIRPAVKEELSALAMVSPAPRREQMAREIRHILIPVHSREQADRMTRIACDLSSLYTADITAVYTVEVPRALPVDADLPAPLQAAEDVLEIASHIADTVYDRRIETVTLQARSAGAAIVEYATQRHIDLVLLGAHRDGRQTRDGQVFGGTADYVARNAHCAVWTVREGGDGLNGGPAQTAR
jgi:APA family basic amino acid/polyamine antiporter